MLVNSDTLKTLEETVGQETVQELVDLYVDTSPEVIAQLETYADEKNSQQMAFWSHRLKGSSGTLGFDDIHELSKNIEKLCLENKVDEAAALCSKVRSLYQQTEQAIKSL